MFNPVIILVRPQLGENIGAAARAMLNFGFDKLRIVSPRDHWPNPKAIDAAAGASTIVENAQIYNNLPDAIGDLNFLFATSARQRFINKKCHNIKNLASYIKQKKFTNFGILFGPERTGLTNQEISFANEIIYIATSDLCPSINLAQSVAIISYELSSLINAKMAKEYETATQEEVIAFFNLLESLLTSKNFFRIPEKKEIMIHNIRAIFKRIDPLTSQDIRTLNGIIKFLSH